MSVDEVMSPDGKPKTDLKEDGPVTDLHKPKVTSLSYVCIIFSFCFSISFPLFSSL